MELAQIYKNLGDITKAYAIAYNMIISQKELPNIENINSLDTPIYLTYAKAYDILGNTQLAKIYYQIAFNLNPNIDIPENIIQIRLKNYNIYLLLSLILMTQLLLN